ncbi:amino acid permease [Patulibacter americanus]|uniref:amino acid permease n=1 Tax=Patulibacter americanus TaxID=588672 RepID=UPI0003B48603|nr:amino acid permease [Patulibacter americanus]
MSTLTRKKTVAASIADTEDPESGLKREMGALQLTIFGVGVIVGTGIFVLTGVAAAEKAGPAAPLSFVVAAIVCGLAALCYAEFASSVPVAGSAYTYSYTSLGEIFAWIIGWDLILEFAFGAATVAKGWSGYFSRLMEDLGINLPASVVGQEASFNVPAVVIVAIVAAVLIVGIRESSRMNIVVVAIKLSVILLVIALGFFYVKSGNWTPFIPESQPGAAGQGFDETPLIQEILGQPTSAFGVSGIFFGASLVFFAFIGFDIVATAAEETKRPQRDLPIGIFASLIICTILYVLVSLVVTGMVPYKELGSPEAIGAPLAYAFKVNGVDWASTVISIGALAGLTSTVLILMYGQSRVFFAMGRDGLLPPWLSKVHPTYKTPYRITIITAIAVALLAAFLPLKVLGEATNIGTLFAFVLVAIAVPVLRKSQPDLERPFRTPLVPLIPILAVLACLWLMLNLPIGTWIRLAIWMAIGFVVYFGYARKHSRLNRSGSDDGPGTGGPAPTAGAAD